MRRAVAGAALGLLGLAPLLSCPSHAQELTNEVTEIPSALPVPTPPPTVSTNALGPATPTKPDEPTVNRELRDLYLRQQSRRLGLPGGSPDTRQSAARHPERRWHSEAEVGATGYRGNTDSDLLTLRIKSERATTNSALTLAAHGYIGSSEGERSQENAGANLAYRHDVHDRFYGSGELRYYYDALADLDYQTMILLSMGYDLIKDEDTRFTLEAGPAYIMEKKGGTRDEFVAARLAATVEHRIGQQVLLWEQAEYLPALNDTSVYLVLAEVGVESVLSSWLSFRTTVQLRYDSNPAEGKEEADLFMTAALVARY